MTDYFELMRLHPELFVNSNEDNAITILKDPSDIKEVEKSTNQKTGIIYKDKYIMLLKDAVAFPDNSKGTYIRSLARDIAKVFNKTYGNTFVIPTEVIKEDVATIAGTDGRKMSKSYNNVIPLFCEEAKLKKLVSGIVTDSSLPSEPKSTDCALFKLYKLFGSEAEVSAYAKRFAEGISWADAKKELFEVMNKTLAPMREKYNYYMTHYDEVEKILIDGSKRARKIAQETLLRARNAIGL